MACFTSYGYDTVFQPLEESGEVSFAGAAAGGLSGGSGDILTLGIIIGELHVLFRAVQLHCHAPGEALASQFCGPRRLNCILSRRKLSFRSSVKASLNLGRFRSALE